MPTHESGTQQTIFRIRCLWRQAISISETGRPLMHLLLALLLLHRSNRLAHIVACVQYGRRNNTAAIIRWIVQNRIGANRYRYGDCGVYVKASAFALDLECA